VEATCRTGNKVAFGILLPFDSPTPCLKKLYLLLKGLILIKGKQAGGPSSFWAAILQMAQLLPARSRRSWTLPSTRSNLLRNGIIEEMKAQREDWKKHHEIDSLNQDEIAEYHRLFTQRYEDLLNAGSGSCLLRDPANATIVDNALHHFDKERYILDEYIIMPNHVHLLVKPIQGHDLKDILHSWKSFTANKINRLTKKSGQLWQHESYDHIVRHERAMQAIRQYIRDNPKK